MSSSWISTIPAQDYSGQKTDKAVAMMEAMEAAMAKEQQEMNDLQLELLLEKHQVELGLLEAGDNDNESVCSRSSFKSTSSKKSISSSISGSTAAMGKKAGSLARKMLGLPQRPVKTEGNQAMAA